MTGVTGVRDRAAALGLLQLTNGIGLVVGTDAALVASLLCLTPSPFSRASAGWLSCVSYGRAVCVGCVCCCVSVLLSYCDGCHPTENKGDPDCCRGCRRCQITQLVGPYAMPQQYCVISPLLESSDVSKVGTVASLLRAPGMLHVLALRAVVGLLMNSLNTVLMLVTSERSNSPKDSGITVSLFGLSIMVS